VLAAECRLIIPFPQLIIKDNTYNRKYSKSYFCRSLNALQAYTEFTGKMPGELIDEAEQEISDGVLPRK
jgi:hypothetical protein